MSFIVGLTGGIGCGKSATADLFAELGAALVDTDAIAHELTAPNGAAIAPIRAAFGDALTTTNGALDRAAMRKLVFSDNTAKLRLEGLLHPLIRAESERRCEGATAPYVVLVVPLLVESGGYRSRVHRVVVVDCPEEMQVARVMARSGLTTADVRAIMATQATREQRLAAADDTIDNSGDLAALRLQVLTLHRQYLEKAGVS